VWNGPVSMFLDVRLRLHSDIRGNRLAPWRWMRRLLRWLSGFTNPNEKFLMGLGKGSPRREREQEIYSWQNLRKGGAGVRVDEMFDETLQ